MNTAVGNKSSECHRWGWAAADVRLLLACLCAFLLAGCSAVPSPPDTPGDACSDVTPLFAASDALDDEGHLCHDWIDKTHGRVAGSRNASAVVWSRRTAFGTALLVSAMHTLGAGWFGPSEEPLTATLFDPTLEMGIARFNLIEATGGNVEAEFAPMFTLYHPSMPAEEHVGSLEDILPRRDFFVGILDGQRLEDMNQASLLHLTDTETPLYDPGQFTTTGPTFANAGTNALVLALGFPRSGDTAGLLSASVGRVLSDSEAESAIIELAAAGDVEGDIPYDPAVEIIIEGFALGGMSGGGVFDADSRLVAVIVRASDPLDGMQYVRAVRMDFIAAELAKAVTEASGTLQAAVGPYIESPAAKRPFAFEPGAALLSELVH